MSRHSNQMPTPEIEHISWVVSVIRCSSVRPSTSACRRARTTPVTDRRDRGGGRVPVDVDDRVVGLLRRRPEQAGGHLLAVDGLLAGTLGGRRYRTGWRSWRAPRDGRRSASPHWGPPSSDAVKKGSCYCGTHATRGGGFGRVTQHHRRRRLQSSRRRTGAGRAGPSTGGPAARSWWPAAVEAVRVAGPRLRGGRRRPRCRRLEDGHLPLLQRQGRARGRRPGAHLDRRPAAGRGCSVELAVERGGPTSPGCVPWSPRSSS